MIRLPLYEISHEIKPSNTGNAGLWYNKFCNQWREVTWSLQSYSVGTGRNRQNINPKQNWIDTVAGRKAGDERLLLDAVERRQEMVDKVSGIALYFETISPFVTGLGNPHPIENGFTWHHLFGMPFLPASSVKGLVRDWATTWADDKHQNHKDVTRIFGPEDKEDNKNTGSIIFLDAIPTKPVLLKSEIMTPHYGDYYQSSTECLETPGDWLSPTPIPFLAVAEKQEFQFALISRCGDEHDTDLKIAADWLTAALQTVGAGGKTAVGYGIMAETDFSIRQRLNKTKEQERQREEESAHEHAVHEGKVSGFKGIALEIYVLAAENNWSDNHAVFYSGAEEQIPLIQQEKDQKARKQAAKYLADMLEKTKNKGIMNNPDKKIGKKNKNVYKARARQLACNLLKILP